MANTEKIEQDSKESDGNGSRFLLLFAAISLLITVFLIFIHQKNEPVRTELDLSHAGNAIVYAELANLFAEPEKYNGISVRLHGSFELNERKSGENTIKTLYCNVQDATACCSLGLPFVLADESAELPKSGAKITIRGVFGKTADADGEYCALTNAIIEHRYD